MRRPTLKTTQQNPPATLQAHFRYQKIIEVVPSVVLSLSVASLRLLYPCDLLELDQIALVALLLLRPSAKRVAGALSTEPAVHASRPRSPV